MAGPWENYAADATPDAAAPASAKPWEKYADPTAAPAPAQPKPPKDESYNPITASMPGEGFLGKLGNIAGAATEPIASMATGALAAPVSGLAGIAGSVIPGPPGQGADWARKTGSAMTYEPKSEGGKIGLEAINKPFEMLQKGAEWTGGKVSEKTGSPLAGTAVSTLIQALPMAYGAKKAGKLTEATPKEAGVLAAEQAKNAPKDMIRAAAKELDVTTPPEGFTFTGLAGKAKVANWVSEENKPVFNKLVSEDLEGTALTPEKIDAYIKDKGQAYERVIREASQGPVTRERPPKLERSSLVDERGKPITREIPRPPQQVEGMMPVGDAFKQKIAGMIEPLKQKFEEMPNVFGSLKGSISILEDLQKTEMNPRNAMAAIKQMRKEGYATLRGKYDPEAYSTAYTKLSAAEALDDLFEANIKDPQVLKDYKAARVQIAKAYAVKASIDDTGNIIPQKLYAIAKKRPLTDNLDFVAKFYDAYPEAAKKVVGAKEGLGFWDMAWVLGSIGLKHPGMALADIAVRMGVPFAASKGWLSKGEPRYDVGRIRKGAPAALTVGAAQIPEPPQQ